MKLGDIIGDRYCLQKVLGQGAGGIVYLALDNRLNKAVAVKVLYTEDTEQIRNELQLQKGLRHPMLPGILDVIKAEQTCGIVMEYIDGVTLDAYLEKNGALEEKQAVMIALQLLDVLKYLHTGRPPVIYQDLKPANIMLCKDGDVKLIDFGTSAYQYFDGRKVLAQGTKGYASPEQLSGDGRQIGVQSDLYSFGAVLYSMLTGIRLQYPPYRMDDIRALFPHISEPIAEVIEGCCAEMPAERFQDVRDVEDAISSARTRQDKKYVTSLLKSVFNTHCRHRKKEKLHYTARVKSVFLSAKKHAGLWSMIFLLCVGHPVTGAITSKLHQIALSQGALTGTVLPVTVYNEQGQKVLIKYGSVYDLQGNFLLEVPKESLLSDATTTLRITVSGPFGISHKERIFLLNLVQ